MNIGAVAYLKGAWPSARASGVVMQIRAEAGSPSGASPLVLTHVTTRQSATAGVAGLYRATKEALSCLLYRVALSAFFGGSPLKLVKALCHFCTTALQSNVFLPKAKYAYVPSLNFTGSPVFSVVIS